MATILRYDSILDFVTRMSRRPGYTDRSADRSWNNNVSGAESLKRAENGDPSLVPLYNDILGRISPVAIEGFETRWLPTVAGPRVSVPDYLAGNPFDMRRRTRTAAVPPTVEIYFNLGIQAGIDASRALKRGAAVLALLEACQASRVTVNMHLVFDSDGACGNLYQVIDIPSQSLDLATAGFAIAHPAFTRNLLHSNAAGRGWTGSFAADLKAMGLNSERYTKHVRNLLELQPTDIYIPAMYRYDDQFDQPEEWINARLSQALSKLGVTP